MDAERKNAKEVSMDGQMKARTLFVRETDGEHRDVSLWMDADGLWIQERTAGALTRSVFGESWHVQQMLIKPLFIEAAAQTLGTDGGGLPEAVERFFQIASYRVLADLMDYFDRNDIAYDFRAFGPGSAAFRTADGECVFRHVEI